MKKIQRFSSSRINPINRHRMKDNPMSQTLRTIFIAALVSILTLFIGSRFVFNQDVSMDKKETAYERVLRTGKIRCGYLASKFFVDIDPYANEFSGIFVDYMNALAKNLDLEIDWIEEVGRGDYPAGLEHDRYDAYCTPLTATAERGKSSDFIRPFLVDAFHIYTKAGVTKFDDKIESLNNKNVTMVATEGDVFTRIIRKRFPKTKLIELPQLSGDTDPLMYVKTGKADAVIMNADIGNHFAKMNPDTIQKVKFKEPFIYMPYSIATKTDEYRFTKMLDVATMELLANGTIDKIINKYDPNNEVYLRIAKPYQQSQLMN